MKPMMRKLIEQLKSNLACRFSFESKGINPDELLKELEATQKKQILGYDHDGSPIYPNSNLIDDEGIAHRLVWDESALKYRLEFWYGDNDWDWDAQMEDYYNHKTKRFEWLWVTAQLPKELTNEDKE